MSRVIIGQSQTVVAYHFTIRQDDNVKQAGADEFVRQIKKLLCKSK